MSEDVHVGELPRRGPFRIRGSYFPKELLKGLLWFLLFGAIGGGFAVYGVILASQFLETSNIWNQGKKAYALGYKGRVRTTNLVFKSYDLTIYYRTQQGQRFKRKVEFFRFFTGPKKKDGYTIKYLPNQPKKAAMSWEHDARFHGWVFVLLMLAMAALMLWALYAISISIVRDAFKLRRLARDGSLVPALIHNVLQVDNPQTGGVEYLYQFSYQRDKSYGGEFKVLDPADHPLLIDNGDKLVVLAAQSGPEHKVLRNDGHPLLLGQS
ncbi:MAG: hypothetical protein EP343_33285 [Deltaproteobacteria bacterium]|nr:MAG: hypothetical protein EP343_33285 [Deltaproteobacteria bacterium]